MSSSPLVRSTGAHIETTIPRLGGPGRIFRKAPSGHGLIFTLAAGAHGLFTRAPPLQTGLVSLAEFEASLMQQGTTSGCEGFRAAQGLAVASNAVGRPLPFVASPDALYRAARCVQRQPVNGTLPPLTDSGCATVEMLTALSTVGIVPIDAAPVPGGYTDIDVATINREPRLDELEAEALTLVTGQYALDLTNAADAIATLQGALNQKWPLWIDVIVGSNFNAWWQDWTPGTEPLDTPEATSDPARSGHALLVTELYVDTTGAVTVSGINSWGVGGAPPFDPVAKNQTGHFRVTASWLAASCYSATIGRIAEAA